MLRRFSTTDITSVVSFQQKYARSWPIFVVLPGEIYLSPGFNTQQVVCCAYDDERLLVIAPLYFQVVKSPPDLVFIA